MMMSMRCTIYTLRKVKIMNKFRLSKISLNNYKLFEKREIDFDKAKMVPMDMVKQAYLRQ